MTSYTDIPYSPKGYKECILDVHIPDCDSFPVFVYFHGGGLEKGDKVLKAMPELLTQNGIAVVSANYRMFPDCNYPDFIEDSADCVAWVKNNISKYGSCKGIYVGGSSAGGYLSMMLCFDKRWYEAAGISNEDISGYVHDAGQPTAHFNVLKYNGVDPRRVIVDETSPLYHIGEDKAYPPMLFIVSDNDMRNRYEQTMLTLSTLKHFGHGEKIELKLMHGKHCAYCGRVDEDGKSTFGKIILEFIEKYN